MNRRFPIAVAAAVTAGLLTGCVRAGPGDVAAPSNEPTITSTTTVIDALLPLEPTTTAPLPTLAPPTVPLDTVAPETAPPNPCSATPVVPGEALEFSELIADLDGDVIPDRLRTFGLPTADGLMQWRARLELGHGPVSEVELTDAFAPVRLLGPVQVDANLGSGIGLAEEVLVSVGTSASGLNLEVFGTDEQRCLIRFGDGLGQPTLFTVGATVLRADGLRCEASAGSQYLVQLTAESTDGSSYVTHDTKIQRVGTNLVPETITDGTASADGPSLPTYAQVDCPGITLP